MQAEVLRYAAFTRAGLGGNPAGVVLDASALDEPAMLAIAAKVGYSETAFLTGGTVRYFSPRGEVSFCGHATVAAAVALAERDGPGELTLTTPAGPVTVETRREDAVLRATLTSVPTRVAPVSPDELADSLAALRWGSAELDPSLPPRVAYAGAHHLVLAAATRHRLATLDYDYLALERLMAAKGWTTVHLVHRLGAGRFAVRNPFPPGGVFEDPATGAAAAAFGGYLRDLGLIKGPTRITLWQGEEIGWPSELLVDINTDDHRVRVSGTAIRIDQLAPRQEWLGTDKGSG